MTITIKNVSGDPAAVLPAPFSAPLAVGAEVKKVFPRVKVQNPDNTLRPDFAALVASGFTVTIEPPTKPA